MRQPKLHLSVAIEMKVVSFINISQTLPRDWQREAKDVDRVFFLVTFRVVTKGRNAGS